MQTKLTVIVDNIPQEPLHGEWGLSILAAHRGSSILIDAGASGLFAENMRALGLSIRDVDCAMLSHAHYDHANGMVRFFQENATAKFYLRESAQENCYARYLIFRKYIGLPRHVLTDYKDRIVHVSGDYLLSDGAYLIGHKARAYRRSESANGCIRKRHAGSCRMIFRTSRVWCWRPSGGS